jgi:hypothetical protein
MGEIEAAPDPDPIPGPDGPDGDRDRGVRLPHAGRPDEEDTLVLRDKAAGRELAEPGAGQLGIEAPVEIREIQDLTDPGLFEPAGEEPVGPPGELVLHEQFQKLAMSQLGAEGLLHPSGQGFGHAGETKVAEARLELRGHRRHSKRYSVSARMLSWVWVRTRAVAAPGAASVRRLRSL